MSYVVLWTDDKEGNERQPSFHSLGGRLAESSVIADYHSSSRQRSHAGVD